MLILVIAIFSWKSCELLWRQTFFFLESLIFVDLNDPQFGILL